MIWKYAVCLSAVLLSGGRIHGFGVGAWDCGHVKRCFFIMDDRPLKATAGPISVFRMPIDAIHWLSYSVPACFFSSCGQSSAAGE